MESEKGCILQKFGLILSGKWVLWVEWCFTTGRLGVSYSVVHMGEVGLGVGLLKQYYDTYIGDAQEQTEKI